MATMIRVVTLLALSVSLAFAQRTADDIDLAFARLYNFDFNGAHAILTKRIAATPNDPLPYAVRSSAYLFYELDRLSILETEFFASDTRIADKKKVKPDPAIRASLLKAIDEAQSRADALLAKDPNHQDALFAMCITSGVLTDYTALVEKKQISSLSLIKKGAAYANRLLKLNPSYYDAYLTTGMTEYVLGSLPFFVRWFVKVDDVEGSKERGIETVTKVAQHGRYLKPFAKILLAVAHLREKRPRAAEALLYELSHDYPENPLFKKELASLTVKIKSGR